AEQHPRKSAQHDAAQKFRGDPRGRRQQDRGASAARDQPARDQREERREKSLVERQQADAEHGRRQGDAAEGADDRAGPVERPREIDEAGGESEEKRAERRLSARAPLNRARRSPVVSGQRDQQRNASDPRKRWMTVTGETQREQRARHERKRVVEADDHRKSRVSD